jgi:hypothetical protein
MKNDVQERHAKGFENKKTKKGTKPVIQVSPLAWAIA